MEPMWTGLQVDGMIEKHNGGQEEKGGVMESDGWTGAPSRALLTENK